LEVQQEALSEDALPSLCPVEPGESVRTESVKSRATQTAPPPRYTEATLLAAMEEAGLGTPATQASMIEGLLADRDGRGGAKEPYARREGKAQHLAPTTKGMEQIAFLKTHGIECLTTPHMTGEWEQRLQGVEKGQCTRPDFMADITRLTTDIIDRLKQHARALPPLARETLAVPCPRCGNGVAVTTRTFECGGQCGLVIWREVCRRVLSVSEGNELLSAGAISKLDGFVSLRGKKRRVFAAGLKLDIQHNKVLLVFDGPSEAPCGTEGSAEAVALTTPCPRCSGPIRLRGPAYQCDRGDFRVQSTLAGRAFTVDEIERLIRDHQHPPLSGFTGRTGQFAAALRLTTDFRRIEFVFH
jgi:DNA topoisomerase-3